MQRIFHIVERGAWALAESAGEYRPDSLLTDGFVHFSFADQVADTANLLFADAVNICVVEFDPERSGLTVVLEDSYGSGTQFPHVYGPIPTSAAVAVYDLDKDADGRYRFSPGAGDAAAPA
ncbi:MAG: hypothetical protein QOE97_1024 [Pseudonocardiales bacterium]|jgi:uncharacterized protein (DUF952 family)|nr:hypothetical protein [Pseudonocardiales bacterium]